MDQSRRLSAELGDERPLTPKTLYVHPKHTQLRRYNRYQDVEIDAFLLPHDEIGKFLVALAEEEAKWLSRLGYKLNEQSMRTNALFWVKVSVKLSHLLPPLIGSGAFTVHHATPGYIMLVKGPSGHSSMANVPLYGTHYTRVECLVVESLAERQHANCLIVREMIGSTECTKKLVTGSVESGEYINQAAVREVLEETGVTTKFIGVLGIVNRLSTRFNRDEILVGCLLLATSVGQVPKTLSSEIRDAEWSPISELLVSGNYMTKKWCAAYVSICENFPAHSSMMGQEIPDFRGHGHEMMMFSFM